MKKQKKKQKKKKKTKKNKQKKKKNILLNTVVSFESRQVITKTSLFKYTENFTTKNEKFSDKKSDNFHIFAQNIDCGYSLEPLLTPVLLYKSGV